MCVSHIHTCVLVYVLLYLTCISYKSLSLNFWKSRNLSLERWGRLERAQAEQQALQRQQAEFPNQQQRLEVELVGLATYRVFLEKEFESLNMVLSLQVIDTALTGVFLLEFYSHYQCWQTKKRCFKKLNKHWKVNTHIKHLLNVCDVWMLKEGSVTTSVVLIIMSRGTCFSCEQMHN